MNSSEQKLMSTVESLIPEILDFTSRLVACPSTLGKEASVLEVMENELGRLSLDPFRVKISPQELADHPGFAPVPWDYEGRYNVTATRPADAVGGKSALFNGHLDVVSPEPLSRWKRDPFDPFQKDGWLYGRGAGDMKAGVAAMTYALHAVDKAGMGLQAPVTIEAVIEEECSGNGALACRNAGIDAEAVLIPEPFGPTILTSQVGVAWFKVLLSGVPVHVLEAGSGVNAIEKCHPLFQALRGLEEELNRTVHPAFIGLEHPVNLNIGIIKGGDWPSTVPGEAEFHCRIGFFPGVSYESIHQQVTECIQNAARKDDWLAQNPPKLNFYGFRSEGHTVDSNHPVFRTLSDCQMSLSERPAQEFVSTATTDLRSFVHFGKGNATCFGPIAENIHGDNERVDINSVIHTAKAYALFLARWCHIID
ncbi:MAG: ArgE/DapE family deacylase [Deltaproteobacteria bacterium]|jgi:acetylornithine deacetylase|nr:ArgE/DapE family deacylase [Deltaproteobacteria bacterium]